MEIEHLFRLLLSFPFVSEVNNMRLSLPYRFIRATGGKKLTAIGSTFDTARVFFLGEPGF